MCEIYDYAVTLASLHMLISQEMHVFLHLGFHFKSVVGEQLGNLKPQCQRNSERDLERRNKLH